MEKNRGDEKKNLGYSQNEEVEWTKIKGTKLKNSFYQKKNI